MLANILHRAALLYAVAVWVWLGLTRRVYDRWYWLFLVNSFAPFVLLPAFVLAPLAALFGWWFTAAATGSIAVYGALFYRRRLLPRPPRSGDVSLLVMTANVLGYNRDPAPTIAAFRTSGADIIAIQELNNELAAAIARDLIDQFPYQLLEPDADVQGMGVISRVPIRSLPLEMPGRWVGPPQLIELEYSGVAISFVNMHAIPPIGSKAFASRNASIKERTRQAQLLAALAVAQQRPTIIVGDLNASEWSEAYALLSRGLNDAWLSGGRGFGHTFPGAASAGSSRPRIGHLLVPQWLVRIDYVFCSAEWNVISASNGGWDGVSDHRPVLAQLRLRGD